MSTIKELLEAEAEAWTALRARFDRLDDAAWARVGFDGGWTPKDLLAHVAAWHDEATSMLSGYVATGDPPGWRDTDSFNAAVTERCKNLPRDAVETMAAESRATYLDTCARLVDPLIERIVQVVVFNGERHYADHLEEFDAFLEGNDR